MGGWGDQREKEKTQSNSTENNTVMEYFKNTISIPKEQSVIKHTNCNNRRLIMVAIRNCIVSV